MALIAVVSGSTASGLAQTDTPELGLSYKNYWYVESLPYLEHLMGPARAVALTDSIAGNLMYASANVAQFALTALRVGPLDADRLADAAGTLRATARVLGKSGRHEQAIDVLIHARVLDAVLSQQKGRNVRSDVMTIVSDAVGGFAKAARGSLESRMDATGALENSFGLYVAFTAEACRRETGRPAPFRRNTMSRFLIEDLKKAGHGSAADVISSNPGMQAVINSIGTNSPTDPFDDQIPLPAPRPRPVFM